MKKAFKLASRASFGMAKCLYLFQIDQFSQKFQFFAGIFRWRHVQSSVHVTTRLIWPELTCSTTFVLKIRSLNRIRHDSIGVSNIGPDLASQIPTSNCNFYTYVKKATSEFAAFQPTDVNNVYQLLSGLSGNKATGIDKISCKILKIAAPAIADSELVGNIILLAFVFYSMSSLFYVQVSLVLWRNGENFLRKH